MLMEVLFVCFNTPSTFTYRFLDFMSSNSDVLGALITALAWGGTKAGRPSCSQT